MTPMLSLNSTLNKKIISNKNFYKLKEKYQPLIYNAENLSFKWHDILRNFNNNPGGHCFKFNKTQAFASIFNYETTSLKKEDAQLSFPLLLFTFPTLLSTIEVENLPKLISLFEPNPQGKTIIENDGVHLDGANVVTYTFSSSNLNAIKKDILFWFNIHSFLGIIKTEDYNSIKSYLSEFGATLGFKRSEKTQLHYTRLAILKLLTTLQDYMCAKRFSDVFKKRAEQESVSEYHFYNKVTAPSFYVSDQKGIQTPVFENFF